MRIGTLLINRIFIMFYAIFFVFLIVAYVLYFFLKNKTRNIDISQYAITYDTVKKNDIYPVEKIPLVIWTYWHSSELPLTVQRCIESWRKYNPDFDIRVLNDGNLKSFLSDVPEAIDQVHLTKKADWIRLALLAKYGGVWLDSSVILTQSLAWINDASLRKESEFVGFYLNGYSSGGEFPVVENWFLAAQEGSAFIQDWFSVFHQQVIVETTDKYLETLKDHGVLSDLLQNIGSPTYHTMHVACQQILQLGVDLAERKPSDYRLRLICAEKSAYAYHVQSRWKRRALFVRLLWNAQTIDAPVLIKLRGGERRKIDFYLRNKLFRKKSLVGLNLF